MAGYDCGAYPKLLKDKAVMTNDDDEDVCRVDEDEEFDGSAVLFLHFPGLVNILFSIQFASTIQAQLE